MTEIVNTLIGQKWWKKMILLKLPEECFLEEAPHGDFVWCEGSNYLRPGNFIKVGDNTYTVLGCKVFKDDTTYFWVEEV